MNQLNIFDFEENAENRIPTFDPNLKDLKKEMNELFLWSKSRFKSLDVRIVLYFGLPTIIFQKNVQSRFNPQDIKVRLSLHQGLLFLDINYFDRKNWICLGFEIKQNWDLQFCNIVERYLGTK
jgi:hypothetical protein